MATFGEVWTAIVPAAVAAAPLTDDQLAREVAWVRVLKSRVPAFDALEAGDIAIVPASALAVVAPGAVETAALVDALVAAQGAGVLVIEGEGFEALVESFEAAAAPAGIPALRVGRTDPNQLERSVIGFLVNRRAELEHQAGLLEASLEEVALGSGDVEALIGAVGGFLGRAVALEGRRGDVIAVHAPEHVPDAAAAVARYLAGSRSAALRVALPAPAGGGTRMTPAGSGAAATGSRGASRSSSAGRLVLLGDREATDLERAVGPRIGRLLALELARAEAVRRATDSRRPEVLPADGPPWLVLVARQVAPGEGGGGSTVEAREENRSRLRALASPRRLALRGDAESLEVRLVLAAADRRPRAGSCSATNFVAEQSVLASQVSDVLGRPVALSRPFDEPGGRPAAEAEARATLEAIELLPDPPSVATAERLPGYRLLAAIRILPDGRRHAQALLAPLLTGTGDAQRERLNTLRAVLDHPGFAEAATALGIHRNTLAYRMRRIEALTGWRLSDPDLRLPLSIAIRLVQDDQINGS